MQLNETVINEGLENEQLYAAVHTLISRLDAWSEQLPVYLKETTENLEHYTSIGLGTSFSAMHMGYHYYNQVLLYQFLAIASEHPQARTHDYHLQAKSYARRCTQHAMAFGDVLHACDSITGGKENFFLMLAHLIVVTSTVHMHSLLFDDPESEITKIARSRLETNFAKLTAMQVYWGKPLDNSLSRLKSFHRACLMSIERSFRFDTWMLRFIQAYGVNIPDKFFPDGCDLGQTVTIGPVASRMLQMATPSSSVSSESSLQAWYSETFA